MRTVFIVEDETSIAELLARVLRRKGYEAICLEDGQQALVALSDPQVHRPDLVLLDLMLPVMDGWEFLRRIRAEPQWEHLPVVIVSADGSDISRREAWRLGVKQYLVKAGFSMDQLLHAVQEHSLPHSCPDAALSPPSAQPPAPPS